MSHFVKTETILDKILQRKVEEIASAKQQCPVATLEREIAQANMPALPVIPALNHAHVALIAEVKHASPSRGVLIDPFDPLALAQIYAQHGASMISVLTDETFFKGHLDYLRQIRTAVSIPLLRKEFVIDEYQVVEARWAGADAVLLIVAALDDQQLANLHQAILALGMTPLIEVHNEAEVERALKVNASLLGVNTRDLKTFTLDLGTVARLRGMIPHGVTLVAESGMHTVADIHRMGQQGASAVLIGEGLVVAPDIAEQVRLFSQVERVV